MYQEVVEGDVSDLRADENIGGVANEGGRPADVGEENLGEQKWIGLDFHLPSDGQGDRDYKQDGGDVVQGGGQDRGDDGKHHQDSPRFRLGLLRRPDGEVLEDPTSAGHRDDDHHSDEQAQDIQIFRRNRGFLVDDTEQEHEGSGEHGDDRSVELLHHDECVGEEKNSGCNPQGVHAEDTFRDVCLVVHPGRTAWGGERE